MNPATNYLIKGRLAPRPMLGTNILLVPVYDVFNPGKTRLNVYSMLLCPLVAGEKYKLSFFINTSRRKYFCLDFYFCNKEPSSLGFNEKNISPTFSITADNVVADMKQEWKAVEYYFTATGNERFCMLGNLSQKISYEIDEKMNASGIVFYFIDEIKLTATDNKPLCNDYAYNIQKLYDQDYRHTDHALVDTDAVKPPKPVFINDTITVPALFFETGSAQLKPSFKKIMDSVANMLSQKNISKIDIIGHTDNKGKPEDNVLLSLTRAQAVKNYLVDKLPQYADNTFIAGKGQEQPVADNSTETGRTKNRRVEIILTILQEKK